jgi:hypothetical protein
MDGSTKQRYISTSIWSDEWFDSLSSMEKLIYFNLLTNIHTNVAGVYPFALKYICADTGCSREEVNAAMKKFKEAGKAFFYREYIIIPKWLKHQKIKERSGLFLGAVKVLKNLPDEIKDFIADRNHYDYDISIYIERSPTPPQDLFETSTKEMGDHPIDSGETSLGDTQEFPPNSAHDLDLDSDLDPDLDIETNNTTNHAEKCKTSPKPKKPPIREREPENDMERVEKLYLQNWDTLYSQKLVQTPDPVVDWIQTRSNLKKLFEKGLRSEQIIQGINNGLKDTWIMGKGYSLNIMLTRSILNSLINSGKGQKHRIANDNTTDDDVNKYFRRI